MPNRKFLISLKEEFWEAAEDEAMQRHMTLNAFLSRALEDYLVDVRARCRLLKTHPPSPVERLAGIQR